MNDTTPTRQPQYARLDYWKQLLVEACAPLLDLEAASAIALSERRGPGGAGAGAGGDADLGDDAVRMSVRLGTGDAIGLAGVPPERIDELRRAARDAATTTGAHALYLGLGILVWRDATGTARRAPLRLVPVALEGDALIAAPLPATFNDALGDTLERDHELVLDRTLALPALLEAVAGATVTRPGWQLERGAVLLACSLAPVALARDAEAFGDELLSRPLVARLALGGGEPMSIAAPTAAAARTPAPVAPLDADADQLRAIAAAAAGASFILSAPPGTGATQTIANLAVHAAAHGQPLLVVADRRTAIDAIVARLDGVGLADVCLDLHAPREQALLGLARTLDRAFRPGTGPTGADERLAELAGTLDRFAAALHARGPLGRSLHDVIGRLVELRDTPAAAVTAALADGDAAGLDRATFERRLTAVGELAIAALPVEPVATHPWRASGLDAPAGDTRERAASALDEATAAATALGAALAELAALVPGIVARTPAQLEAVGAMARVAATSARPGAELVSQVRAGHGDELAEQVALVRARGGGAIDVPRDPAAFVAVAVRHRALVAQVAEHFTEAVEQLDVPALWMQLKRWTGSMAPLRYVALRSARAQVAAAGVLPTASGGFATDDAMIDALEAVIAERACRRALAVATEPARRWFGELGGDPMALDLDRVESAVAWASELRRAFDALTLAGGDSGRQAAWRALVAQIAAGPASSASDLAVFTRVADAVARWRAALDDTAAATGVPRACLGDGADAPGESHLARLGEQLAAWRYAVDGLSDWARYQAAHHAARSAGATIAVRAIERGEVAAADLAPAWERATLLAWSDAEVANVPALAEFHGASHHAQVAAFADLDRGALALARARALVRIAERVPRVARGTRTTGDDQLDAEIFALHAAALAQPQPALRDVLAAIPALLPRLAPVVLGSPAEVAALLPPGARFATVVIEDASQLPTAHALSALARAEASVIVGDAQLLAPVVGAGVLADARAAGYPELALRTHYRSRHDDVFAAANAHVYGGAVAVFPAPGASTELGVAWRPVEGAAPDVEAIAEAVAAEVVARLREPVSRGRSLAVVALSRELAIAADRAVDRALERAGLPRAGQAGEPLAEPVIVRHVDAAQGDVRDAVILAADGAAASTASTASTVSSDRQLAVALTRAREQLIVVAPAGAVLPPALAAAVELSRASERPDAEPASAITAAIGRALVERGWSVRHRVGAGAYRVDLAVVDPADPARLVLAIEHDGAAYASAPAARDRDRLRAQVLAQLGWRTHRIWSIDWWLDPAAEIQRAHGAIVAAIAASRQRRAPAAAPRTRAARTSRAPLAAGSAPIAQPAMHRVRAAAASGPLSTTSSPTSNAATISIPPLAAGSGPTTAAAALAADATPELVDHASTTPVRIARNAIPIGPYLAATIPAGRRHPDDLFAPRYAGEVGKIIEQVLAAEAPMHVDLLARRVGAYFGIGRVTQRVGDQIRAAIPGRGRWGEEQGVVWRLDQDPAAVPPVRVAGAAAETRREIDDVPLSELAAAARIVVERAPAIVTTELVRDAARLLGFARLTDQVAGRVARGVRLAQLREMIAIDDTGHARIVV